MRETCQVRDHLDRLHAARASTYHSGSLVHEVAALYMPTGLAGKAMLGSMAASMTSSLAALSGGSAASGTLGRARNGVAGGGAFGDDTVSCRVVGYTYAGGRTTWGVLDSPEALGLPRQRAVTRAAIDRVRPPTWQLPRGHKAPPRPCSKQTHKAKLQQQPERQLPAPK